MPYHMKHQSPVHGLCIVFSLKTVYPCDCLHEGDIKDGRCSLPSSVAPRGSLGVVKRTGSCMDGMAVSVVAHAILCDEPHATRVMRTPSSPCTRAGFLLTVVVPSPCCPWSLSPQANTYDKK